MWRLRRLRKLVGCQAPAQCLSLRRIFAPLCHSRALSSSKTVLRTPLEQYDHLVLKKSIRNDEYQRGILKNLQSLHHDLLNYHPEAKSRTLFSLFSSPDPPPRGIYLHGDVGCGKTMLMDMFYSTVPDHLTKKRIHFHAFMQDIHRRAHALKQKHGINFEAARPIARALADESTVLCFDEFQVIDVADAMMLRTLLTLLLDPDHGVVLFMTSNRAPDQLYENGVQRQSFLPCIATIKDRNHVINLLSPTDYRKLARESQGTYFFPPSLDSTLEQVAAQARVHVDSWFRRLAGLTDLSVEPANVVLDDSLEIWGRKVRIPKSVPGKVAQFTFAELCDKPLSAADYLEITRAYPGIVVSGIPLLSIHQTDVLRRFITFLDAAYESKTKLALTAQRPFEHLFNDHVPGLDLTKNADMDPDSDSVEDSAFAGSDERFAFSRALSRLKHMSSQQWHQM